MRAYLKFKWADTLNMKYLERDEVESWILIGATGDECLY